MTPDSITQVAARLDDLVVSVAELLAVECAGLLLRDSADRLRTVSSSGSAADQLERAQETTGAGPGPDVHRAGIPIAVADVLAVPDYADLAPLLRGSGVRAVMSAPVLAGDVVVGNLNGVDPAPHPWTDRQQAALQTFAALVADVLVLSAASRGEDVAHLTDDLADLDDLDDLDGAMP
ncbi:GAF domain-containing protein [Klenkia sp. LSe6-5]|uniref:GAF domain-containing protein n=1 Tax=Klenkia sesuvii TaxID=3103137 RepID=A0ABU8DVS3_9ACTN